MHRIGASEPSSPDSGEIRQSLLCDPDFSLPNYPGPQLGQIIFPLSGCPLPCASGSDQGTMATLASSSAPPRIGGSLPSQARGDFPCPSTFEEIWLGFPVPPKELEQCGNFSLTHGVASRLVGLSNGSPVSDCYIPSSYATGGVLAGWFPRLRGLK